MGDHPVFSWFLHHVGHRMEPAEVRRLRRALAARAQGTVLEVGAGDGVSLSLYAPSAVSRVVAVEPDAYMRRYLRQAARHLPVSVTVLAGRAEALPLADASVDTVVCSLVLCSVRAPEAALKEARRVLRPGGRLLFLEHVASPARGWLRLQKALNPVWSRLAAGCHLDRDTEAEVARAGFEVEVLERLGGSFQPVVLAQAVAVGPSGKGR